MHNLGRLAPRREITRKGASRSTKIASMSRVTSTKTGRAGTHDEHSLKIPTGIDLSTFFAPSIPEDLKVAFPLFHQYPEEIIAGLTKLIVKYLAAGDSFSLPSKLYSSDVEQGHLNLLLTAIYIVFKQAVRSKTKLSVIRADLTAMKFPAHFVEIVCNEMLTARVNLESAALTHRLHFAKLEKLRWRIDVIISSGSLSRIMRPSILMQMVLKDGRIKTFEVSTEQFNQLRYSVAKVLHEIQTVERHPIIKLVNEFKRREEEEYNH